MPEQAAPEPKSFAFSILSWASLVIGLIPASVAVVLVPTLDLWPYVLCGAIGSVLGYPIVVRVWRTLAGTARSAMWLGVWITPPLWGIGLGVGANALLDRSPKVDHATEIVGRVTSGKNGHKLLFPSWREGHERESYPDRLGAKPGEAIIVTTRTGFFGWERIVALRRATR